MSSYEQAPLKNLEQVPTLGISAWAELGEVSTSSAMRNRLDTVLMTDASVEADGDGQNLFLSFAAAPHILHSELAARVQVSRISMVNGVAMVPVRGADNLRMGVYAGSERDARLDNKHFLQVFMMGDVDSEHSLAVAASTIQSVGFLLARRYIETSLLQVLEVGLTREPYATERRDFTYRQMATAAGKSC